MSTTVQETWTNVSSNQYPEITRMTQLTFTGDSVPIWNGTISIGDELTSFNHYSGSIFNFSFSTVSTSFIIFGNGSKRVLTYNLDKKLVVVSDLTTPNTTETYPAYLCYPRIGLMKSASSYIWLGRTSRDKYMTNQDCANNYGNFFTCLNTPNNIAASTSRKTTIGSVSLYSHFCVTIPNTVNNLNLHGQTIRMGDGIYLADGDISDMFADCGRIISDGTHAYICCGYRIWMDYE